MTILVECICGEKFSVETNHTRHKSNTESLSTFVGSRKCPNSRCNNTIYVDVIVYPQIDNDPVITAKTKGIGKTELIDWDKIKEGDAFYHGGLPFKVTHKFTEYEKRTLALRSLYHGDNVIAEVDESGNVSFDFDKTPPHTATKL